VPRDDAMIAAVTGASGFIGRHLVRRLVKEGMDVRLLEHRSSWHWPESCQTFAGDVTDPASLKGLLSGADIVFHLAAALGASTLDRKGFERINVFGTVNLLQEARRTGVQRVVHFSSAGVLGRVQPGEVADESTPCRPQDVYDQTKLAGEQKALEDAAAGQDVVILRPGWVYGPEDRRTFKLIRPIARRRFMLVTRGRALQTPVFIDDLIQGILLCAQKGESGAIYHLAGPEVLSVRQIVDAVAAGCGTRVPRVTLPLFPVRIAAWKLDKTFRWFRREAPLTPGKLAFFIHPKPLSSAKAQRDLGYVPAIDFLTGMTRTIAWYRDHGWL